MILDREGGMADLPYWRRWRRAFWAQVARMVLASAQRWPAPLHRVACQALASLAPLLQPGAARRARRNLALAFGDRSPAWRRRVLWRMMPALGRNLHAALTSEREAAHGFPSVAADAGGAEGDLAGVLAAEASGGRGAFLLTGHLGCWELLGTWLAHRLGGLTVVTATVHNPAVDRLLQDRRRALGMTPLPRDGGARPILRALDEGRVVGVLLDQATRVQSRPLPFFGRPAPTPVGIARLARRRDVAIVPAALVWEDGRWRPQVLPPLRPAAFASDADLAAACNAALETLIARNPAQWVWFHRRWP
ncbi:hypothetical protein GF314_08905 [bacterium]|nr:hypothetical protein [bacterium]